MDNLQPFYFFGYSGNIVNAINVHPCMNNILYYPCGNKLIIEDVRTRNQTILQEETKEISAISLSSSGKLIAVAHLPYSGFKALICVWDLEINEVHSKYESHKDIVHSLIFSKCEKYILSIGGYEDDNNVLCYNIAKSTVLYGCNAKNCTSGGASIIDKCELEETVFITAGENTFRVWINNNKLSFIDVPFVKVKRKILCAQVNKNSLFAYFGTFAGDILKFKLNVKTEISATFVGCFGKFIQNKRSKEVRCEVNRYSLGVTALLILKDNKLIIGAGNGTLEKVREQAIHTKFRSESDKLLPSPSLPAFVTEKTLNLGSKITAIKYSTDAVYVSTERCEIYSVDLLNFKTKLLIHGYPSGIQSVAFPHCYSEVFATGSHGKICIWAMKNPRLILTIQESNATCCSVVFSYDGSLIISSWDDGYVKVHTPETGNMVSAVRISQRPESSIVSISCDNKVINGTQNGYVNILIFGNNQLILIEKMRQHRGHILSVDTDPSGKLAASSGIEGLIVMWDFILNKNAFTIFSGTVSKSVKFHPSGLELISCGDDKEIKFWNTTDGSLIKRIKGSISAALNTLDVSNDGGFMVTEDNSIIKMWKLQEMPLNSVNTNTFRKTCIIRFSPDQKFVLSADINDLMAFKCPASTNV